MEDIIPLLIVIAISIIGAIGRKKKRNERENISSPERSAQRDDDFLGWLEKLNITEDESPFLEEKTFVGIEKEVAPQVKTEVVKEPVAKDLIPNIYSKYSGFISPEERENLMSKEGISTVIKRGIDEGDLTKQTANDLQSNEKMPKFEVDLKKAVIYNEIINRKYI